MGLKGICILCHTSLFIRILYDVFLKLLFVTIDTFFKHSCQFFFAKLMLRVNFCSSFISRGLALFLRYVGLSLFLRILFYVPFFGR